VAAAGRRPTSPLTLAYLRNSETYADLACGSRIGTTTVYRYVREPLDLRAARAPRLAESIEVARGKAKAPVVLDGTLLRIDRLGMTGGRYRPYYSGKHKCHGVNVQVIADPAGHLTWTLAALPGARHDMGAAREHGITDAIADAGVPAVADTAYQGSGPAVRPRNGVDAPTPTPAATDACPSIKRTSTPPTPANADRESGQRPDQELEDPPQDPLQPPAARQPSATPSRPSSSRLIAG
jgi:hypothetical protein